MRLSRLNWLLSLFSYEKYACNQELEREHGGYGNKSGHFRALVKRGECQDSIAIAAILILPRVLCALHREAVKQSWEIAFGDG